MDFEIIGEISDIETIAVGEECSCSYPLAKAVWQGPLAQAEGRRQRAPRGWHGADGTVRMAEVHWYEAHGIGKREFKLKLPFLDRR